MCVRVLVLLYYVNLFKFAAGEKAPHKSSLSLQAGG